MKSINLILIVLLINSQVFAACFAYTKHYPGKADMQQILQQATNLGIDSSIDVDRIIGKSYKTPVVKIIYEPHENTEFYSTNFELTCREKDQWICEKTEMVQLRYDLEMEKDIIAEKSPDISAKELVEVALAANNQRPMSWYKPISSIVHKNKKIFNVVFGSGECTHSLAIERFRENNENTFLVHWDKINVNSGCIYTCECSNDSRFILYENDEWKE